MNKRTPQDRLFIGIYPGGIVYSDRVREEAGEYRRIGFLSYATLELDLRDCPPALRPAVETHARSIQAKRGQFFETSTCGQGVVLGGGQ